MLIKNFQAGTIQDALELVRKEFGAQAVILKTDVLRQNGTRVFSVTAARDYNAQTVLAPTTTVATAPTPAPVAIPQSGSSRLESALLDVVIPELVDGQIKQYFLNLRCHDVESQLALDICRRLQRADKPSRENLVKILSAITPQAVDLPNKDSNIVFVGPCGSGKSSMLAKFATEYVFHRKQKVTIETLDNFRPGAEEEITNLNEILDLASEVHQLKLQPRKIAHHLIDTTGIPLGDRDAMSTLATQLQTVDNRFTVLVISLTMGWPQIRKYIEFTSALKIDAIALTQLDATDSCGAILNLAIGEYPPLLCLSDSRLPNVVMYNFDVTNWLDKLIGDIDA